MAKKKEQEQQEQQPAAPAPAPLGFERDPNGYGALPGFENFRIPEEGFAIGAVVNDSEVFVLSLTDDEPAAEVAARWVEGDENMTGWNPTAPEGEGWTLSAIVPSDFGPRAVFSRPTNAKSGKSYACQAAADFLLGHLIKACTKHLKTLSKPWIELKENEQARVLGAVGHDCREAVRDAIDIIASNARLTFTAAVEQVVFKDGVKAVLTLTKGPHAHSLADAEGSYVTIVIEDRSKLLDEGDSMEPDPDQKPLFDQSTEGTKPQTEEQVLKAA
jgi:hypothetical protein